MHFPSSIRLGLLCLILAAAAIAAPGGLTFSPSAASVETYDYIEITLNISAPDVGNPFTGATLSGWFAKAGATERVNADGFCDSADGSVFRIRFMPSSPGRYEFSLVYRQDGFEKRQDGAFEAMPSKRRGPIRVDPEYPWHFIWEGTKEHYFFNGTTSFWLMGWREERIIQDAIERLHNLKINRMRVLLAGGSFTFYGEPVMTGDNFTYFLRPWPAKSPQDLMNPGIDYSRFDVALWQRFERMLRYARERDMIISVIQDISDARIHLVPFSEEERRYLRYAAARFGAFSNITWDMGDDMDSFRDEKWAHEMGTLLVGWDEAHHLASSHPVHRVNQDRASPWMGFTSIQDWSRQQHTLMLEEREIQKKTGRIIPQTNEEYGYEDHYPHWAPEPPGDSAEVLRHMAWEIAMAGAYGTAGESARRGVNIWPDTGGGWVNGRGDDNMIMLKGYAHMVDFFTSFDWWKTEPHDELLAGGRAFCLAKLGDIYAVYIPDRPMCGSNDAYEYKQACAPLTLRLEPGTYEAHWFGAYTGEVVPLPPVEGPNWTLPKAPGGLDWALLLQKSPKH